MKNLFSNASWIWYTEAVCPDSYGDFTDNFYYKCGKAVCHISCDGDYTLFVNGVFVASNQYGDFEHYKIYDSIDITNFLNLGENSILITVWHLGIASQKYKTAKAGLLYQIDCEYDTLAKSSSETLSRENPNYKSGYKKMITSQIGQSFLFDSTKDSNVPFKNSVVVDKNCQMFPRPIKKQVLLDKRPGVVIKSEPTRFLLDLGEETVGLFTFRFNSSAEQKITVAWGEHIVDGCVRRKIQNRDFSLEYIAKKGENNFTNYMLRLGCRYLEIFCESPIELEFAGLIPQIYPTTTLPKKFADKKTQKIYDLCVRSLNLCMMEHYVDTPWREQGLYTFDSRNQMLCGYKAFEGMNKEYARANLLLISKDMREDNLLAITYPCGTDLAIPCFSLYYFVEVKEYIEHTNDLTLGFEVYDKLLSILEVFIKRISGGLLYSFKEKKYWNFYDWTDSMTENIGIENTRADLMINCLFVRALESFKFISERLEKPFDFEETLEKLKDNIRSAFFRKEIGLFSLVTDEDIFTVLANSLAILCGIPTKEESRVIAEKLLNGTLEECSLSMKCFEYDALLSVDEKYRKDIIEEIHKNYGMMLANGATSTWEVLEGSAAFCNSGSLCHGWSAIPILYL